MFLLYAIVCSIVVSKASGKVHRQLAVQSDVSKGYLALLHATEPLDCTSTIAAKGIQYNIR